MLASFNIRLNPKADKYTDFSSNILAKLVREIFKI